MSRKRPPNRHTGQEFSYEATEHFLSGQWVPFFSDWAIAARWLAATNALEIQFKNGHHEFYPADRPTALSFAFAPSKGGFIWDHYLQHKKRH